MPITEILEKNAKLYGDDVALIEINPQELENRHTSWREYSLIEPSRIASFRSEITWGEFDRKANRLANLLLSKGVKKGTKVGILLMNCLEWLPIYFGILKSGAMAVPLNFRYTADEIKYCAELADIEILIFGPEFTGRTAATGIFRAAPDPWLLQFLQWSAASASGQASLLCANAKAHRSGVFRRLRP